MKLTDEEIMRMAVPFWFDGQTFSVLGFARALLAAHPDHSGDGGEKACVCGDGEDCAACDRLNAAPVSQDGSEGALDYVKPLVDAWIRSRGTSMDGKSYFAALQLAAHVAAAQPSGAEVLTDDQQKLIAEASTLMEMQADHDENLGIYEPASVLRDRAARLSALLPRSEP